MKNRFDIKKALVHAVQGAIVGVGAILPGVSGGVLCVSFGIYEPIMELLTEPKAALKKNTKMFIPFFVGWAIGFLLLARLMEMLFSFASDVAIMLFFGLVCGTLPELFKKSEESDRKCSWTPLIISMASSYVLFHILEGGGELVVPANFLSFMFCGFMWGLSLIIPGLSSSTVLIYLGLYVPLSEGIADFDIGVLLPFGIGILATALLLARLVNTLFKRNYAVMSRVILGFVISSSLKTLPSAFENALSMIISIICFGVGFWIAIAMDRAEKKRAQENGG